jgi:hypothetical protein
MIDDPDARQEEWRDKTFAGSQEEATSKCRRLAEQMSKGGSLVRSLGATHISGRLYECRFISEVPQNDSNR